MVKQSAMEKALNGVQANWEIGAKTKDGTPDGVYTMKLEDAELVQSSNDNPMIKRKHTIIEGEFGGMSVFDNLVLSTDFGCAAAIKWIELLGLEPPEDITNIEEIIEEINAECATVSAQVKSKDGFSNVTVRALSDEGYEEPMEPEDEPEDETPTKKKKASKKKKPEPEPEPEEDEEQIKAMREFCIANSVDDVDEDTDDKDTIVAAICEYEYEADDLTEEELVMLESIGATINKPKKATKKKASKKK